MYGEHRDMLENAGTAFNYRGEQNEEISSTSREPDTVRSLRRHRIWQVENWLHHSPVSVREIEEKGPRVITRIQSQHWLDKWVNKAFEEFRLLAEHVNSVMGGNFFLWHKPNLSGKVAVEDGYAKLFFYGYICNARWALVVRGWENRIQIFITPLELILGSPRAEASIGGDPYIEIWGEVHSGVLVWRIEDYPITYGMIPSLVRQLFDDFLLISTSQGKAAQRKNIAEIMGDRNPEANSDAVQFIGSHLSRIGIEFGRIIDYAACERCRLVHEASSALARHDLPYYLQACNQLHSIDQFQDSTTKLLAHWQTILYDS